MDSYKKLINDIKSVDNLLLTKKAALPFAEQVRIEAEQLIGKLLAVYKDNQIATDKIEIIAQLLEDVQNDAGLNKTNKL